MTHELVFLSGPLNEILRKSRERNLYVRKVTLCRRQYASLVELNVVTESNSLSGPVAIRRDEFLPDGHAVIECYPVPKDNALASMLDAIDKALGVKSREAN